MASPTAVQVEVTRFIRHGREKLFEALTGRDALSQWFCPEECVVKSARSDAALGGGYSVSMECNGQIYTAQGAYREIVAPQKLVFTHQWQQAGSKETLVTIELEEVNGGTQVRLTQSGFDDAAEANEHQKGWASTLRHFEKHVIALRSATPR